MKYDNTFISWFSAYAGSNLMLPSTNVGVSLVKSNNQTLQAIWSSIGFTADFPYSSFDGQLADHVLEWKSVMGYGKDVVTPTFPILTKPAEFTPRLEHFQAATGTQTVVYLRGVPANTRVELLLLTLNGSQVRAFQGFILPTDGVILRYDPGERIYTRFSGVVEINNRSYTV
jgi:hypothetical protein